MGVLPVQQPAMGVLPTNKKSAEFFTSHHKGDAGARCVGGFIAQHAEFAVCRCGAEPGDEPVWEGETDRETYLSSSDTQRRWQQVLSQGLGLIWSILTLCFSC
jgi:hypothetical protein